MTAPWRLLLAHLIVLGGQGIESRLSGGDAPALEAFGDGCGSARAAARSTAALARRGCRRIVSGLQRLKAWSPSEAIATLSRRRRSEARVARLVDCHGTVSPSRAWSSGGRKRRRSAGRGGSGDAPRRAHTAGSTPKGPPRTTSRCRLCARSPESTTTARRAVRESDRAGTAYWGAERTPALFWREMTGRRAATIVGGATNFPPVID